MPQTCPNSILARHRSTPQSNFYGKSKWGKKTLVGTVVCGEGGSSSLGSRIKMPLEFCVQQLLNVL